jgi:hypothetical protein
MHFDDWRVEGAMLVAEEAVGREAKRLHWKQMAEVSEQSYHAFLQN